MGQIPPEVPPTPQELLAQESSSLYIPSRAIPNDLRKGINVAHIWGGMEFWYTQGYVENGVVKQRFPNIYTNTGIAPIFNYTIAKRIKNMGFGHVRFFIDPLMIRVKNTSTGQWELPSNGGVSSGMQALLDDMQDAHDAGLSVVINFFPKWISPKHQEWTVIGPVPNPPLPSDDINNLDNPNAWKRQSSLNPHYNDPFLYPGPWRKDYSMHWGLVDEVVSVNHPLRVDWRYLASIFTTAFPEAEGWLYFQPISEAQVDYTNPKFFTAAENAVVGAGVNGAVRRARWRAIQLATIKDIQDIAKEFHILVSSNESFPHTYLNQNTYGVATGSLFTPYNANDGITELNKLIYTFHMYAPIAFTHPSSGDPQTNPLMHYAQFSTDLIPAEPQRDDYSNAARNGLSTFSPHVVLPATDAFKRRRAKGYMNLMHQWKAIHWPNADSEDESTFAPALMITEFGAKRIPASGLIDVNPVEDGLVWAPRDTPAYQNAFPYDTERARWTWDIRTLAEANNYGWTYFDFSSQFGAVIERMFAGNDPTLAATPSPGTFAPGFNAALIQGPRP